MINKLKYITIGIRLTTSLNYGKGHYARCIELAKELNLKVPDVSWHSIRDNFCETTGWLALVGSSLGKIAYDIMLMMQTETQEVSEPFLHGRGSSSTMPQKRNPISSEVILACSKILLL